MNAFSRLLCTTRAAACSACTVYCTLYVAVYAIACSGKSGYGECSGGAHAALVAASDRAKTIGHLRPVGWRAAVDRWIGGVAKSVGLGNDAPLRSPQQG